MKPNHLFSQEWDKFDVEKEMQRLEEEEKKQQEYAEFAKKAADPYESAHGRADADADSLHTYSVDSMTPLERRIAAKVSTPRQIHAHGMYVIVWYTYKDV
jgi:hypothetical protein